jgi:hypothetical protein
MNESGSRNGKGGDKDKLVPQSDEDYYPPLSDNRYKGLIYWWTFGEQRADPEQLARYVSCW